MRRTLLNICYAMSVIAATCSVTQAQPGARAIYDPNANFAGVVQGPQIATQAGLAVVGGDVAVMAQGENTCAMASAIVNRAREDNVTVLKLALNARVQAVHCSGCCCATRHCTMGHVAPVLVARPAPQLPAFPAPVVVMTLPPVNNTTTHNTWAPSRTTTVAPVYAPSATLAPVHAPTRTTTVAPSCTTVSSTTRTPAPVVVPPVVVPPVIVPVPPDPPTTGSWPPGVIPPPGTPPPPPGWQPYPGWKPPPGWTVLGV